MRSFLIDRLIENGKINSSVVPITRLTRDNNVAETSASTSVVNTALTIAANGGLIYVIEVEPVEINAIKITHFYDYAQYCPDIQPTETLKINVSEEHLNHYGPDVADYFKTPFELSYPGSSREDLSPPTRCPLCQSHLFKVDGIVRCLSIKCPGTLPTRIRHWPAWQLIDIPKPGFQLIDTLIQKLHITSPLDLHSITPKELIRQCDISPERAKEMVQALRNLEQKPWPYILTGLGIRHLRHNDLNQINRLYSSLAELEEKVQRNDLRTANFRHKAIEESLHAWFKVMDNRRSLSQIKSQFQTSQNSHQALLPEHQEHLKALYGTLASNFKGLQGNINHLDLTLHEISSEVSEKQMQLLEAISGLPQNESIQKAITNFSEKNDIKKISEDIELWGSEILEAIQKERKRQKKIETLTEGRKRATETISSLKQDLAKKEIDITVAQEENSALTQKQTETISQRDWWKSMAEQHKDELTRNSEVLRTIKQNQQETIAQNTKEQEKLRSDKQDLETDLTTFQRLHHEQTQKLKVLQDSLSPTLDHLATQIKIYTTQEPQLKELEALQSSLTNIHSELLAIPPVAIPLIEKAKHVEKELTLQGQYNQQLINNLNSIQTEKDTVSAELEAQKEALNQAVAQQHEKASEIEQLQKTYDALHRNHKECLQEKDRLQARITQLEEKTKAKRTGGLCWPFKSSKEKKREKDKP